MRFVATLLFNFIVTCNFIDTSSAQSSPKERDFLSTFGQTHEHEDHQELGSPSSPQRYHTPSSELRVPDSLREKLQWGVFRFPSKHFFQYHVTNQPIGRGRNRSIYTGFITIPSNKEFRVLVNHLGDIFGYMEKKNVIYRIYSFPAYDMMTINISNGDVVRKLSEDEKAYLERYPRGNPPLF